MTPQVSASVGAVPQALADIVLGGAGATVSQLTVPTFVGPIVNRQRATQSAKAAPLLAAGFAALTPASRFGTSWVSW